MALNPPVLHQKPLKRSQSLDELRVSNGQPRYFDNKEGKLQGLHLANTSLKDKELADLLAGNDSSALEVLHIARNELTELTLTLPALTFLDARENKGLTTVDLSGCPKLEKVVLNRCAVASLKLPESLSKLKQLEVANNRLTELSLGNSVESLRFLDVSDNQLTQPPTVLANSKDDFYLLASGNQFDDITSGILLDEKLSDEERRERLKKHLSRFISDIEVKGEIEYVNALKIIFLGNTQVGKTTLADLLTGKNKAKKGSTHGVNLFEKMIGKTQVIGIDFGGQDYYHSVHFSLFNKQALYLLLWGNGQADGFGTVKNDKSKEQEDIYPLNYWLGAVEYFMRRNRKKSRLEKDWKEKDLHLYLINNQKLGIEEKILDLNNRDLKENHRVDELYRFCLSPEENPKARNEAKQVIHRLIEKHQIKQPRLEYYMPLLNAIGQAKKEGELLLTFEELGESLGSETKIETEDLKEAITYLSYSVACHYLDETTLKEDSPDKVIPFEEALLTHFIVDLSKFTGWLYTILNNEDLRKKNGGYFDKQNAISWLGKSEAKKHLDYILGFMLHHKIIFEVKGRKDFYVVPQYLKPIEAGGVGELFLESFDAPLVKYEFDSYFHSNILAELIKCLYDDLLQEETGMKYIMWKNKVVLYKVPSERDKATENAPNVPADEPGEEVTVPEKLVKVPEAKQKEEKRFLYLDFQLPDAGSLTKPTISLSRYAKKPVDDTYMQDIMEIIEKQIEYYQYTKWVKSPFGTYIPFDRLKQEKVLDSENQKESNLIFYDRFVYRRGDFKLFLRNEELDMKKIFISYSHADESSKEEFKRHFVSLINENKISTFDDRELTMGGEWDPELKKKIDECDIMVCLVSVDFLNTRYIMEIEIPRAIEMGKTIVPIIVRPCDWTNTILGKYNGTLKGKVIALFEDRNQHDMPTFRSTSREERDMFWLEVVKEFRAKVF